MEMPIESPQSTLDGFLSTQPPPPTRRVENRRIDGKTWFLVEHPGNIRRNSPRSRIWEHGGEYVDIQDPDGPHYWICDHCDSIIKLARSQTRFNISRHLRNIHKIETKREISEIEEEEQDITQVAQTGTFKTLVTTVDVNRFRRLLVRWIVQSQTPFSAVKSVQFRDLLVYL